MDIYETFLKALEHAAYKHFKNPSQLAAHLGVDANLITRWLKRERVPMLTSVSQVLGLLGAKLVFSDQGADMSREVCFVDAKVVEAGNGLPPPHCEDYFAVPLVGEVGAGMGYLPQDELISWLLVWRWEESVRHRSNLIAVQLGKDAHSMVPALHPGDIVLVDRNDRNITSNGKMWLVIDPLDSSGKIKRVHLKDMMEEKDIRLTFASDNPEYPPETYSLNGDYYGDFSNAIGGRVIWAWSNVTNK